MAGKLFCMNLNDEKKFCMNLNDFPDEILLEIFKKLDYEALCKCSR